MYKTETDTVYMDSCDHNLTCDISVNHIVVGQLFSATV